MAIAGHANAALRKILRDPETCASVLLVALVDAFGTEVLEWDPETVEMELDDLAGAGMPQVNQDKFFALSTALTTDRFYQDPIVFWHTCAALSDYPVSFQAGSPELDTDMAAWGVVEVTLNDVPDGETPHPEFSPDVATMVGVVARREGFAQAPNYLQWAIMPRPVSLDPVTERAQQERDRDAGQGLREFVQGRLEQLRAQLRALPLSPDSRPSTGTPGSDFLERTLSLARDAARSAPARE